MDGSERPAVELHRCRPRKRSVGEAGADPVVANDAMRACEVLEERTGLRLVPLLLEVGHEAAAEEEQRPLAGGGVRDPPAVELAEADVLLHGLSV